VRSFIDTNVLVYAHSGDAAGKQARATALIAEHPCEGSLEVTVQRMVGRLAR
jgi:predicted nucleic acid-binding protein